MRLLTRNGRAAALGPLGFVALALVGCEAIFTFSPVSFLQTPLTNMSPDELSSFGADAFTTGDPEAMQAALGAIVGRGFIFWFLRLLGLGLLAGFRVGHRFSVHSGECRR